MATKKNTAKTVINEKVVKATIKAYNAEITSLIKERETHYKAADTLNDKVYKLEDTVGELTQILRLKKVLALVAA